MERHTGTFNARAADGSRYTIRIFTNFIDVSTMCNPNAEAETYKRLVTSNGDRVNRIEKGKYEVLSGHGSVAVSSDDPDVP